MAPSLFVETDYVVSAGNSQGEAMHAVTTDTWKYIGSAKQESIYTDSGEMTPTQDGQIAERARAIIELERTRAERLRQHYGIKGLDAPNPVLQKRLESLGYL